MDDIKRKELEALVKTLDGIRGRHTELVTVYVPAGFDLNKVVEQLRNEQGTAENIKSKATRKAVTGALEKTLQHLKLFKQTPTNGLAVFCGNVDGESLELWSLEPPEPLKQRLYWCGQTFVLDPLKELIREKEVYGLILVDKGDAAIGLIVGKQVQLLKQFDSIVLGKTRKGGWCVHEDTAVLCPSGEDVPIKAVGEELLAFDFAKQRTAPAAYAHVFKRRASSALRVATKEGHTIVSTPEHQFFLVKGNGLKVRALGNLRAGDKVAVVERKQAGSARAVAEIERLEPIAAVGWFYDLEVPVHENFIANGFIVHNSANRYARVREGLLEDHLKKVGEIASGYFKDQKDLIGVVIGGPGPIKEQFANGEFLEYSVKQKVLGLVNTAYTGEEGLEEMLGRSEELLRNAKAMKERKLLERFFEELAKDGLAVYGIVETVRALRSGNLELLLLSEGFAWEEASGSCASCGHAETHIVEKGKPVRCPKCGSAVAIAERQDLEQKVLKLAEQMGTRAELISLASPKGEQLQALGGIGGILRYKA